MRIAIQTLGCRVNQSESASIEGILRSNDFEIVHPSDSPDVCIINTCTVTSKSDYQSRQLIRKAARSGARVIAAGCYAQLRADEISKIEGIDFIIGNTGKGDILHYIQKIGKSNGKPLTDAGLTAASLSPRPYYSNRSRAVLKIQDGCNFSCSYCTVPLARGKSRSMTPDDVLMASKGLASHGYREIVLTGIHIGSYGSDLIPESSLFECVKQVSDALPHVRIRLSSIQPQEVKKGLLSLIRNGSLCPHLHVPVQSGSNKILKAMNRGYTAEFFTQVINSIITAYPEISIGTDIIVGFPGESDNDFNDTVNLIDNLPLSYLHVFPYSKRPDTRAFHVDGQVRDKIKKERVRVLIEISKYKKINYMTRYLGTIMDVIVEGRSTNKPYYNAISDNYVRIYIKSDTLVAGERLKVKVISMTDTGLTAEPLI